MRDEISAPDDKPITVRWNMLTPAKVDIIDKNTVKLSQNGKTLFLQFSGDSQLRIKTWSTTGPMDYDAPNPGTMMVGFETLIPAGEKRELTAVFSEMKDRKSENVALDKWKGN